VEFTVAYSLTNPGIFFTETVKEFYKTFFLPQTPSTFEYDIDEAAKKRLADRAARPDYSSDSNLDLHELLVNSELFNRRLIGRTLTTVSQKAKKLQTLSKRVTLIFDINFLRKEKIYTKLKYSRVPQYDIVSGGGAAIFGGFLVYLITEKFGLELLDSGDFWFFFMYLVFFCFALRPLLTSISEDSMN
jgi:hypothetical protein